MFSGVPRPVVRRPISITTLVVATLFVPVVLPIGLVVGIVLDAVALMRGNRSFRHIRCVTLVCALIVVDFVAFLGVLVIFAMAPLGSAEARAARFHWIMRSWASALLSVIAAIVPLRIDTSEADDVSLANTIIVARHRSHLDAILPAVIIGRAGLYSRYTLKEDLRWEPNIDLVGHAIPHRFVTRSPENHDAELARIRELGPFIDDASAAVIFPEGTFFTERRKEQIVTSLERRDPDHADAARSMRHLLPPRPGGTLALLDGAPDADVVILGHVGFEPFGSIPEILRNLGGTHSVRVRAWRFARAEVPVEHAARIDWLFDRWLELDAWIEDQHHVPTDL